MEIIQTRPVPWSDSDDDERSDDKHWAFLCGVARYLRVDVAILVHGKDSGKREALPWCAREDRVFRGNSMRLTEDVVRARDRAHAKLRRAGLDRTMDFILADEHAQVCLVRLTAAYWAYDLELRDIRQDLASLFERRPALRRLPDPERQHVPFWVVNQLLA